MRSSGNGRASLMAAMALAMMGAGMAQAAVPTPRKGSSDHKPEPKPPKIGDLPLAREIAEWNAAVEARKQAKRERRGRAKK